MFLLILGILVLTNCSSTDTPELPPTGDSSGSAQQYAYCVYAAISYCDPGSFVECPPGGIPMNVCPYGTSSSGGSLYSSSSVPDTDDVFCQVGDNCAEDVPLELCLAAGGTQVPSCDVSSSSSEISLSSSSGGVSLSSSSGVSSSSSIASSSSVTSSSSVGISSSSECSPADNTETHYCSNGTLKEYIIIDDERDNKKYKAVEIGTQVWMAENLNYSDEGTIGFCYNATNSSIDNDNCATYGRLYDWATAMGSGASNSSLYGTVSCGSNCYNPATLPHQGICPEGWHIPTYAEWSTLTNYDTGDPSLKATSVWREDGGTDNYGFSALPGGRYNGTYNGIRDYGYWWNATEQNATAIRAIKALSGGTGTMGWGGGHDKSIRYSVRCVRDY